MSIQNLKRRLEGLLLEEVQKMRAKGATDADVKEDAFIQMVSRSVAEHFTLTTEEWEAVWINFINTASPDQLRDSARRLRATGEIEAAYVLECWADIRERSTD